ncbi:Rv0361 family membrane protein [Gordonia iterans]
MPTPDNDQTSSDHDGAVKKVVDAFRARRAGHPDAPAPKVPDDDAPSTPVVKIQAGQTPGGGDSESPTRAFAIPVVDETTEEVSTDEVSTEGVADEVDENATGETGTGDAATDESAAEDETAAAEGSLADDAETSGDTEGSGDTEAFGDTEMSGEQESDAEDTGAEDTAADEDTANEVRQTASGIKHQTVVEVEGSGEKAPVRPRTEVESVDPDQVERAGIVESAVDLSPADDEPETEVIPVPAEAAAASGTAPGDDEDDTDASDTDISDADASEAPTETIDLKNVAAGAAVAAAAGAAGAAATAPSGAAPAGAASSAPTGSTDQAWSNTPHQPEVIPGATPAPAEKKRRTWLWALLALIAAGVVAVLVWWFAFANSPQAKVADAAETYQTAMAEGDLAALRGVTCGEEYAFYSSVSEEEFSRAYQSQKERGQLFSFKEITGVSVNGDTARVGVDIYNDDDPNATTNAQITLHNVGGEWKVCTRP